MNINLLTKRDDALLNRLYELGLLSTKNIRELFFENIATTTTLRRLRVLEKYGLISRVEGLRQGLLLWMITPKGAKRIGGEPLQGNVNKNSLIHDHLISEISITLQKYFLDVQFKSGFTLKRNHTIKSGKYPDSSQVIPDGIFLFKKKDGKPLSLVLELELHRKSKSRYREVFQTYARKEGDFYIWYVVPKKEFGETLLQFWEDLQISSKGSKGLLFTELNQIIDDPINAFLMGRGKKTRLLDLIQAKSQTIQTSPAQADAQTKSTELKYMENKKIKNSLNQKSFLDFTPANPEHPSLTDTNGGLRGRPYTLEKF